MNNYTWTRAFKIASNEPNVLIFAMARTPEREDNFIWLNGFLSLKYSLWAPASNTDKFKGVSDFRHYQIAVVAGSVTHSYMEADGYDNMVVAKDYTHLDQLIKKGRVDMVASSRFALEAFMKKYSYEKGYFAPLQELNYVSVNLYYVMSKGSDPGLVEHVKTALNDNISNLKIPE